MYHLFCSGVCPSVNTRAGASADTRVYASACVWLSDYVCLLERLTASPFSSTCLSSPPTFICQKAQSQKACDSFTCQTCVCISSSLTHVCLSPLLVSSHSLLKSLRLVFLAGLQWNKLESLVWEDSLKAWSKANWLNEESVARDSERKVSKHS